MSSIPGELETVLQRARVAQLEWAARPLAQRLIPVAALRARLAVEPAGLAEIVAREIGKTRFEAIAAEVLPTAEVCAFLLNRAPRLLAPRREALRGTMPFSGTALVRHQPWGVVALLVPWNYPLFLCASSALNALVAGNAVVLKASPRAKATVQALAEWLWQAGIPRDLLPVLDSSDDTGRMLTASPHIDKIIFTGSSRTGRAVLSAAAQNLVPATMELSGCDAVYVLRDADIKLAAAAVSFGARLNAGRTCICPRRVFVEEPVAAEFIQRLSERLTTRALISPMDPQTLKEADDLAARLESTPQTKSLNNRQPGDARKALLYEGGAAALRVTQGNFVPAIVVARVPDLQEALRLDGECGYALGASIFSRNLRAAEAVAGKLRAGLIAINECVAPAGEASLPFGGAGESGYGVRGGDEGLLDMTRPQSLAYARGTYRPHHDAEDEAENLILALLRARHGSSWLGRLKGWFDYAIEGIKWKPPVK
jgi:aldehyde dehydrogenase (NAD+)